MYQVCAAKSLQPNENLFMVIDGWMEKYHTSPRTVINNGGAAALAFEFQYTPKPLIEKKSIISALQKWANENETIVIVTSVSVIVYAASTLLLNSPILSFKDRSLGNTTFLFEAGDTSKDILDELTTGVYYIDENNKIVNEEEETDAFLAEAEIESTGEFNISFPTNELMGRSILRDSVNQMIEEYMQEKTDDISVQTDDIPLQTEEVHSYETPVESINPIESYTLTGNGGTEIVIPSSVKQTGLCANNTPYTYYYGRWKRGTMQRTISEQWAEAGMPSSNGISTLNGRYLVAVAQKFGKVGDNIDIVLSDGQVIPALIADAKGADATSEWGHKMGPNGIYGVDIIEWEAVSNGAGIDLGSWKNVTVAKIINYGKDLVPVIETVEEINSIKEEELQYIELYSSIYGLNSEKIYQLLSFMTDDFNSELYKEQFIIEGNKRINYSSKEMAILLTIHNIYLSPEEYGVTKTEIAGTTLYSSNVSYAKQIEYLSNVLGVDASLNYAICQASCSFNSPMFLVNHNPTNLMAGNNYATFPTVTAGFLEETIELFEKNLSGAPLIDVVGDRVYATLGIIPETWRYNVTEIYNYVSSNYEEIFGSTSDVLVANQKIYSLS